jgi:hypothetical protein
MLKINSRLTLALGLTMWFLFSKEGFVSCTTSYSGIGCFQTSDLNAIDIFNETFNVNQCLSLALPTNIDSSFFNVLPSGVCFFSDRGSTMTVQLCFDLCTANSLRNFTKVGLGW